MRPANGNTSHAPTLPGERLSARRRAFAEAYARDPHGERAARAAGYSERSARSQAAKLLRNVAIRNHLAELGRANTVTAERCVEALGAIAFSTGDKSVRVRALAVLLKYFTPSPPAADVPPFRIDVRYGGRYKPDGSLQDPDPPDAEILTVNTPTEMLAVHFPDPDAPGGPRRDDREPTHSPVSPPIADVTPARVAGRVVQVTGAGAAIRLENGDVLVTDRRELTRGELVTCAQSGSRAVDVTREHEGSTA